MAGESPIATSVASPETLSVMVALPDHSLDFPLVRLTYMSVRSPHVTDHDIVELAIHANRANRGLDITGCLWFGRHRFFQVLEGPQELVDALYGRIQLDPRHSELRLLSYGPLATRQFGRWSLAHVSEHEDRTLDQLIAEYAGVQLHPADTGRPEPSAVRRILDRLASFMGSRPQYQS